MPRLVIVILAGFFLSPTAWGAATYDNAAYGACGNNLGSPADCAAGLTQLTYSLTVGSGSNRGLAVFILFGNWCSGSTAATSTVTYAGVSLIKIGSRNAASCSGSYAELWALPAGTQPASGANNVVITMAAALSNGNSLHSGAISASSVNQSSTFSSYAFNDGNSASATVTLSSSTSNDLVISGVCNGGSVGATPQTARYTNNINGNTSCNNSGGATASGGTTSLSYTVGADIWQIIGASFASVPPCGTACSPTGAMRFNSSMMQVCDGCTWNDMAVSNTNATCSTEVGAIKWNSTNSDFNFCNGTNWWSVKGTQSGGACSPNGKIKWNASAKWYDGCSGGADKAMRSATTVPTWQRSGETSATANTNSISTGNWATNPSNGNFVVCLLDIDDQTVSISSVTDTKGNTYSRAAGPNLGGGGAYDGFSQEIWYAQNITGGATFNVTATYSGTVNKYKFISCHEYSNVQTVNAADGYSTAKSTSGPWVTGPLTLSSSKELVITYIGGWALPGTCGGGGSSRSTLDSNRVWERVYTVVGTAGCSGTLAADWMSTSATFRGK